MKSGISESHEGVEVKNNIIKEKTFKLLGRSLNVFLYLSCKVQSLEGMQPAQRPVRSQAL